MAELDRFRGPLLKLERADKHIAELKAVIDEFLVQSDTHAVEINGEVATHKQLKPFPDHTATIIGDALHNIRAALDHLYSVLIELNGQEPTDWSRFPIGGSDTYVRSQLTPKNPNPSQKVMDVIYDDIRPYEGRNGNNLIVALHKLNIMDKHTIVVPLGHIVHIQEVVITQPNGAVIQLSSIGIGGDEEGSCATEADIVAPGCKIEQKGVPTLEVVFKDSNPLPSGNVLTTLESMRKAAYDIIVTLASVA